jgi:mannobiose 2-epimerase
VNPTKEVQNTMSIEQWNLQLQQELQDNILKFWSEHSIDHVNGGFYGAIEQPMKLIPHAHKGLVLNTRILWTFAAAYRALQVPLYLEIADRAYQYLTDYFLDQTYGGFFWMVDYQGRPSNDKKQIYGQAFAIYALSEYYLATKRQAALDLSITTYHLMEKHSYDSAYKGYVEALSRNWKETDHLSLSRKDLNEKKSMNTHLHVLEAYTNLYRIWPSPILTTSLTELIQVTMKHIIDSHQARFNLFFDEAWNVKGEHISYGHDIEGSWLLVEAAEVLGDHKLLNEVKQTAVAMAAAVLETGVDNDGGIWNEANPDGVTDTNKDWWPQAEAVVGFFNAYQLTGEQKFKQAARHSWEFIQKYLIDRTYGEWYWGVSSDGTPLPHGPKVSAWKCPYHNSRACLEMLKRLK